MKTFVVIFITLFSSAQALAIIPFGFIPRLSNGTTSSDPCAGTPAEGTVCTGGSIYAGILNSNKYMIMPSGCANDTSNPSCSGADTLVNVRFWNGNSGTLVDIPAVENIISSSSASTVLGDVNTPAILANVSVDTNSPAQYCDSMVYGGYGDWYLPSKTEMAFIACRSQISSYSTANPQESSTNCGTFGGKTAVLTGFNTTVPYWTSTEQSNNQAWSQSFLSGAQVAQPKGGTNNNVRCVRKF